MRLERIQAVPLKRQIWKHWPRNGEMNVMKPERIEVAKIQYILIG